MQKKLVILQVLVTLFNNVSNSTGREGNNETLLNISNTYINEVQDINIEDSENEYDNFSINSNISGYNEKWKLFTDNQNNTTKSISDTLKIYMRKVKNINTIKQIVKNNITELKKIKFDVDDNVFNTMNQYIELLKCFKQKLSLNCNRIQKKLLTNLFNSIDNCVDVSKNTMVQMASVPSYGILAPHNTSSYLYALHEYDYLNNNYMENNEEEDFDLLEYDINDIMEDSIMADKTIFAKKNDNKPTPIEIFQNTHNYVTEELHGIMNNSNYKYLNNLKLIVRNILANLNTTIKANLYLNHTSFNYQEYLKIINDLNAKLKKYIGIPDISNTISNIISIVYDRKKIYRGWRKIIRHITCV